jgi:aryl-alcohol dehydrogenase-like predicted oxidoreductase
MDTTKLGLGCMAMSGMYGTTDDAESIRTIHAAIERGITLIDTGDFSGMGHNEMLIGRAIADRRDRVRLSVKFGVRRGPDGTWLGIDTRPMAVKSALAYSLRRLGVEAIDIYRPSRLDPEVPIEDTVGTIADLVRAGYVRAVGLSEVGVETIRRAHRVHPIADLQIGYSVASRSPERAIFPMLRELGIGATLYGVLSRGLLTGSKPQGPRDFRADLPRFTGDNAAQNAVVAARFAAFARERGMTPAQLAFAWVLARQPTFTPLVGVKTVAQLDDILAAKPLSAEDAAQLEAQVTVAGDRYQAQQMRVLDSERG